VTCDDARTTPDPAQLRRLYVDDGLTIAEVAAAVGVAHGTVHQWLIDAGIDRRASPSARRGDLDDDHIRRRYVEADLTATELAAELGCGSSMKGSRVNNSRCIGFGCGGDRGRPGYVLCDGAAVTG
jgi:hypothetical protein